MHCSWDTGISSSLITPIGGKLAVLLNTADASPTCAGRDMPCSMLGCGGGMGASLCSTPRASMSPKRLNQCGAGVSSLSLDTPAPHWFSRFGDIDALGVLHRLAPIPPPQPNIEQGMSRPAHVGEASAVFRRTANLPPIGVMRLDEIPVSQEQCIAGHNAHMLSRSPRPRRRWTET